MAGDHDFEDIDEPIQHISVKFEANQPIESTGLEIPLEEFKDTSFEYKRKRFRIIENAGIYFSIASSLLAHLFIMPMCGAEMISVEEAKSPAGIHDSIDHVASQQDEAPQSLAQDDNHDEPITLGPDPKLEEIVKYKKLNSLRKQKLIEDTAEDLEDGQLDNISLAEFVLTLQTLRYNEYVLEKNKIDPLDEVYNPEHILELFRTDIAEADKLVSRFNSKLENLEILHNYRFKQISNVGYQGKQDSVMDILLTGVYQCESAAELMVLLEDEVTGYKDFGLIAYGNHFDTGLVKDMEGTAIDPTAVRFTPVEYTDGKFLPKPVLAAMYLVKEGVPLEIFPEDIQKYFKDDPSLDKANGVKITLDKYVNISQKPWAAKAPIPTRANKGGGEAELDFEELKPLADLMGFLAIASRNNPVIEQPEQCEPLTFNEYLSNESFYLIMHMIQTRSSFPVVPKWIKKERLKEHPLFSYRHKEMLENPSAELLKQIIEEFVKGDHVKKRFNPDNYFRARAMSTDDIIVKKIHNKLSLDRFISDTPYRSIIGELDTLMKYARSMKYENIDFRNIARWMLFFDDELNDKIHPELKRKIKKAFRPRYAVEAQIMALYILGELKDRSSCPDLVEMLGEKPIVHTRDYELLERTMELVRELGCGNIRQALINRYATMDVDTIGYGGEHQDSFRAKLFEKLMTSDPRFARQFVEFEAFGRDNYAAFRYLNNTPEMANRLKGLIENIVYLNDAEALVIGQIKLEDNGLITHEAGVFVDDYYSEILKKIVAIEGEAAVPFLLKEYNKYARRGPGCENSFARSAVQAYMYAKQPELNLAFVRLPIVEGSKGLDVRLK